MITENKTKFLDKLLPLLIASCALWLVISSIDAAGDYPNNGEGPGVTIDEIFNVQEGIRIETGLQGVVVGSLSLKDIFGQQKDFPPGHQPQIGFHNPDHPPLGRLGIGLCHHLLTALFPLENHPSPFVISAGRTASAVAFALLVYLVALTTSKWYGQMAGVIAGTSLILMPRLLGHAHLAALETITGLMFTTTVLFVAHRWKPGEAISRKNIILAGGILGLMFLTKIQAVLLPIPIACWVAWNWGVQRNDDSHKVSFAKHWFQQVLFPLVCWGGIAFMLFFMLWPWLWLDPVEHLKEYFGRTTNRATLYTWYFSERYIDKEVPWHYTWVMFLVTVPVGLHLLGVIGLWKNHTAWKMPREQLLLGCMLFPLVLFSIPGVAVYDGVRLFLVVFPLWAVFIGKGGSAVIGWMVKRISPRLAIPLFAVFLLSSAWGIVIFHPCYISYYNGLVTTITADEVNMMEKDYWGSAITRSMLEEIAKKVPAGSTIEVTPVLIPFQLEVMQQQSPILRKMNYQLKPYESGTPLSGKYVLFYSRLADLPPEFQQLPEKAILLVETKRGGFRLAGLLHFE